MIHARSVSALVSLVSLAFSLVTVSTGLAVAQTTKPRVPIGVDPGGVAVAVIADAGIDYIDPKIAQRLARDGEGEIIGWDFIDDDRKPFASGSSLAMAVSDRVLREAPSARVAPFRAKPTDRIAIGRAAVYAARSPAKIVLFLLSTENQPDWDAFSEVLGHFKDLLLIVPAGAGVARFPSALGLPNVLSVTDPDAAVVTGAGVAEIAAPSDGAGAAIAAARVAALAARISAADLKSTGAVLKARIIALAKPLPAPREKATVHGWIADPAAASIPVR